MEKGEEIATRLTSGWRVCIDYRKFNAVTRKDHFPLPCIDQVLERVSAILSIVSWTITQGIFKLKSMLKIRKTTFTCPFGTYAYRRMPFGLCNALATFQRCMLSIFNDMVERIMEVFMDDITIYGSTFEECLINLEAVLNKCIEKDLVLNWEKCHFMVQQGIVLGHIISEKGIEVDKAKMSKKFDQLNQFLTIAPIVRAPNWQLPFEVMCNANDFAIGAMLDQEKMESLMLAIAHIPKSYLLMMTFLRITYVLEKTLWYAHIANYLVTGEVPRSVSLKKNNKESSVSAMKVHVEATLPLKNSHDGVAIRV
ncbi:Retrovirus-related Pol polyprotein from transposon 297 [Vitis vinifera]|uniref:Retrovirus-related Pol polyprotein from transposon 297 n=1 Tax=Vitis vinifera TaxID=29760 RepID=A0A438GZW3_VITVI|nr:Retrovirus-related Pol polyprotein from transposon 297 [Vitis vinifera]